MLINLHSGIPKSSQALMWAIFFQSRSRGVSLACHFPWINDNENVYCITIEDSIGSNTNKTVATLALKHAKTMDGQSYGMLGLVCVHEKFRRNGLTSLMIERAIQMAVDLNWTALVLWTQKPKVYEGHGFVIDGQELFANVLNKSASITIEKFNSRFTLQDNNLLSLKGLPSFATGLELLESDCATALLLKMESGFSVAEWSGDKNQVVDLLTKFMPKYWGINFIHGDELIEALMKKGLELKLESTSTRMVRKLVHEGDYDFGRIRILDRI